MILSPHQLQLLSSPIIVNYIRKIDGTYDVSEFAPDLTEWRTISEHQTGQLIEWDMRSSFFLDNPVEGKAKDDEIKCHEGFPRYRAS